MKANPHPLWIILFAILLIISLPRVVQAQSDSSYSLYIGGNETDGVSANQQTYDIFFDETYIYSYTDGTVCLSSRGDECAPLAIDDYVIIWVNENKVVDEESYTQDFGPVDFTPYLQHGDNQIHVQLIDLMGPSRGGSALWLVLSGGSSNPQGNIDNSYSGTDGNCGPNYPPGAWKICDQYLYDQPDKNGYLIGTIPSNEVGNGSVDITACNQGYYWFHFETPIVGWAISVGINDSCPVPQNSIQPYSPPQQSSQDQPLAPSSTEEAPNISPTAEQAPNSIGETWDTSINECEVNSLLYEFYKDQNNQLKLVVANAGGLVDIFNNFFTWVGFLIDSSKVKFEPTADEVKVSLFYSSEGHFQIQVDRYLQGTLLSTNTDQIDQSTYNDYLNNLEACGINT